MVYGGVMFKNTPSEEDGMDAETRKAISAYRKELRRAWPHRHTFRGRTVIDVAVARLRQLQAC